VALLVIERSVFVSRECRCVVGAILEGGLSDLELIERYRRAALCLLTSRLEPLGLTAMEAAACGTPVVAVCEGGYRETVVDGTTGLLADRDPEALGAATVGGILEHSMDGWNHPVQIRCYGDTLVLRSDAYDPADPFDDVVLVAPMAAQTSREVSITEGLR